MEGRWVGDVGDVGDVGEVGEVGGLTRLGVGGYRTIDKPND